MLTFRAVQKMEQAALLKAVSSLQFELWKYKLLDHTAEMLQEAIPARARIGLLTFKVPSSSKVSTTVELS